MADPVQDTHRVVLLGAESTGTTTLAHDLAEALGAPCTYEALRDVCERKAAENDGSFFDVVWHTADFDEVADRQDVVEAQALAAWNPRDAEGRPLAHLAPVLVCDTDALATALWHRRYLGEAPERFFRRAAATPPLLYVLTSPDGVAFEQDGWRDGEHVRLEMHDWFREALDDQPVPWFEVDGARPSRVHRVLDELAAAAAAPA
jgi:HTH-type transcriptional repressor of NAD biosynthesis genes